MHSLNSLFDAISEQMEKHAKLDHLIAITESYCGSDWQDHTTFSSETYTRNLVKKNAHIAMLIVCWEAGQKSDIHDHPSRGCILKVLAGEITEQQYSKDNALTLRGQLTLQAGETSYQEGSTGLHSIINGNTRGVSLHIYSPPDYTPVFYPWPDNQSAVAAE